MLEANRSYQKKIFLYEGRSDELLQLTPDTCSETESILSITLYRIQQRKVKVLHNTPVFFFSRNIFIAFTGAKQI
jgi:hypothetical protein